MQIERVSLGPAGLPADANIRYQYPINRGQWVVHPDIHPRETSVCRYTLAFTLEQSAHIDLHVSADNRFELRCDGEAVGMGPDRSDIEHWTFHSYRLALGAGEHRLEATVSYLYREQPVAQTFIEPGFVLYSENAPVDLNTGSASWQVVRLAGISTSRAPVKGYFVVGPNYTIDAAAFFAADSAVPAAVLRPAGAEGGSGRVEPGWKLHPSRLPEQVRRPISGGTVRFAGELADTDCFPTDASICDPAWQAFVTGEAPVTVDANSRVTVLWDLDQYHTAFPELTTSGGAGSCVRVEWAEACFIPPEPGSKQGRPAKGNRDEIGGKTFVGYGDTFMPDGPTRTFNTFWWRAGRYVRLMIETGAEPLTLESLRLLETRLPLENEGEFRCDDADLGPVVDVAVRGIQMCAHETYMDCPYYEQLMYVGDTRLQMLTSYVMSAEDRLNQRALELFDWSRRETGFVLERYPSDPKQLSTTFAMIWILMLRDYAWWRRDPDFVIQRIKGMRCLLEEFKMHLGDADLLPPLPGWSFMDWVSGLSAVNHPGPDASVASVANLLLINALNAAAELEEVFGEPHLAAYNREWAARLASAVASTFWDDARGLFSEDPGHTRYSEHAQCLAMLSGLFPERDARCFESLITADDLLRTTVYFSFYLLETFARFGRGDLIMQKLDFWKKMVGMGFKTPVEMPEPSRSDCHAWGSHPLFHMHASLAGIRPASPGFASVEIAPCPGPLARLESRIPHPNGEVSVSLRREDEGWIAGVTLPSGVPGKLAWCGKTYDLSDGARIKLPKGSTEPGE